VTQWYHPAFEYAGEEIAIGEIVDRAKTCRTIWGRDGGVTFGEGEPTLQAEKLLAAVDALRTESIHTAIETNANCEIRSIAPNSSSSNWAKRRPSRSDSETWLISRSFMMRDDTVLSSAKQERFSALEPWNAFRPFGRATLRLERILQEFSGCFRESEC
jgi:organic radical activating enzyme